MEPLINIDVEHCYLHKTWISSLNFDIHLNRAIKSKLLVLLGRHISTEHTNFINVIASLPPDNTSMSHVSPAALKLLYSSFYQHGHLKSGNYFKLDCRIQNQLGHTGSRPVILFTAMIDLYGECWNFKNKLENKCVPMVEKVELCSHKCSNSLT